MARQTIHQMLVSVRLQLERMTPVDARLGVADGGFLIDVRTAEQRARDGHVPGALEVSLNVLEWRLDPDSPSRIDGGPGLDDLVIVMCDEGYCSSLAAGRLQALGFRRATDLDGGFRAWRAASLPVDPA